jgi:hypothetical protein
MAMPKRQGPEHDFTVVARRVVEQAIGEKLDGSPLDKNVPSGRVSAARRASNAFDTEIDYAPLHKIYSSETTGRYSPAV